MLGVRRALAHPSRPGLPHGAGPGSHADLLVACPLYPYSASPPTLCGVVSEHASATDRKGNSPHARKPRRVMAHGQEDRLWL